MIEIDAVYMLLPLTQSGKKRPLAGSYVSTYGFFQADDEERHATVFADMASVVACWTTSEHMEELMRNERLDMLRGWHQTGNSLWTYDCYVHNVNSGRLPRPMKNRGKPVGHMCQFLYRAKIVRHYDDQDNHDDHGRFRVNIVAVDDAGWEMFTLSSEDGI